MGRKGLIVMSALLVLMMGGCSTRVRETASRQGRSTVPTTTGAVAEGPGPGSAAPAPAADAVGSSGAGSTSATADAAAQSGGTAGSPSGTPAARSGRAAAGQAAQSGPERRTDAPAKSGAAVGPSPKGATPGVPPPPGGPQPGPPSAAPAGKLSPVLLASIGAYSGPAAATLAPNLYGAQIWVRAINARGGLNGHEVKLIVYDDGFDPARHYSQVKEAIDQRKVIAFLSNNTPISPQSAVDYITQKRVPVIGSFGGTPGMYSSPMYFPQQAHFDPLFASWVSSSAQQLVPAGKKELGIVFCTETPLCSDIARQYKEKGPALGLQLVYEARASIAQPDYTAECFAAKNSGAEALVVILDGNSVNRFVTSCARQSFRPAYQIVASVILDRHKEDPNLDGALGVSNVFPWFQSGTPATDEYQAALKSYGANLGNGVGHATGWVAAKVLEKAGSRLAEPPSSAALLDGLWSIRNDDIGGLTQPLTFERDTVPTQRPCWWNLRVARKAWTSSDGFTRQCS